MLKFTKKTAQKVLQKQHVGGLCVVEGGLAAYIEAGGETLKGSAHISLERQVRITAGSLVLLGVLLSIFVHRGFLILSGFVGAGLIFAGISDLCGMGILLAKMPWNRSGRDQGQVAVGGTCAANPLSGPKEDS